MTSGVDGTRNGSGIGRALGEIAYIPQSGVPIAHRPFSVFDAAGRTDRNSWVSASDPCGAALNVWPAPLPSSSIRPIAPILNPIACCVGGMLLGVALSGLIGTAAIGSGAGFAATMTYFMLTMLGSWVFTAIIVLPSGKGSPQGGGMLGGWDLGRMAESFICSGILGGLGGSIGSCIGALIGWGGVPVSHAIVAPMIQDYVDKGYQLRRYEAWILNAQSTLNESQKQVADLTSQLKAFQEQATEKSNALKDEQAQIQNVDLSKLHPKNPLADVVLVGKTYEGLEMYLDSCRHMLESRFSWFNVGKSLGVPSSIINIESHTAESIQLLVEFLHVPDNYSAIAGKISSIDAALDLYLSVDFYHTDRPPKSADGFIEKFMDSIMEKLHGLVKGCGYAGFVYDIPFDRYLTDGQRHAFLSEASGFYRPDFNEIELDFQHENINSVDPIASWHELDPDENVPCTSHGTSHVDTSVIRMCTARSFEKDSNADKTLSKEVSFYAFMESFSCFDFLKKIPFVESSQIVESSQKNRIEQSWDLGQTTENAMNLFVNFLEAPWNYQTIFNDKENTWHDICELYKLTRKCVLDPERPKPHDHYFKGLRDHISTCLTEISIKESNINANGFIAKLVGLLNDHEWIEELKKHNDNVMSKYLNSFFRACPGELKKKTVMNLWRAARQHGDTLRDLQEQCLNVIASNVHTIDVPEDISEEELIEILNSDHLDIASEHDLLDIITKWIESKKFKIFTSLSNFVIPWQYLFGTWIGNGKFLGAIRFENLIPEVLNEIAKTIADKTGFDYPRIQDDIEAFRKGRTQSLWTQGLYPRRKRPLDIFSWEEKNATIFAWRPGLNKHNIHTQGYCATHYGTTCGCRYVSSKITVASDQYLNFSFIEIEEEEEEQQNVVPIRITHAYNMPSASKTLLRDIFGEFKIEIGWNEGKEGDDFEYKEGKVSYDLCSYETITWDGSFMTRLKKYTIDQPQGRIMIRITRLAEPIPTFAGDSSPL